MLMGITIHSNAAQSKTLLWMVTVSILFQGILVVDFTDQVIISIHCA